MKALRIFYRKTDDQIVWYHETRSPEGVKAVCPSTVEEDLAALPSKMPDGETPLGGVPADYACLEMQEKDITGYFASDSNKIVDGRLKIGEPRLVETEPA